MHTINYNFINLRRLIGIRTDCEMLLKGPHKIILCAALNNWITDMAHDSVNEISTLL